MAKNREWFSVGDLARLQLAGFPWSRRGVQELAKRERWHENPSLVRKRQGQGGGEEFHVSLLPYKLQRQITKRKSPARGADVLRALELLSASPSYAIVQAQALAASVRPVLDQLVAGKQVDEWRIICLTANLEYIEDWLKVLADQQGENPC